MKHQDIEITTFPTDTEGLPECRPPELVELADGDTYELRIGPVAKQVGDDRVRMVAYNGSVPGPTLRVRQGSEVTVVVHNDGDHETTVHWHGLRLDNASDGVPDHTQPAIPVGGSFTCAVRFPDDGLYWYHPHVREDYGLEMGLYGNIVVDPAEGAGWPPVNREAVVTLDDVLIEDGRVAPFRADGPTHTAMGRFGNVMLTGGSTDLTVEAEAGEVVRFFLTDTANTRIFNFAVAGARMKLVAGDSGRFEREAFVDSVLLAPSERAVVDVLFPSAGTYAIEHQTPGHTYRLGSVVVGEGPAQPSFAAEFDTVHTNPELEAERERLASELAREPDKTLVLTALMPILTEGVGDDVSEWTCPMHPEFVSPEQTPCPQCGMKLVPVGADMGGHGHDAGHGHAHDTGDGLEWEDLMPDLNARTDATNMIWKIVDADTGHENAAIDWRLRVGDRVKVRLVNTMDSDHPMHHPFHVHGAGRFLVLSRDGAAEDNLVWKDTVLVRAGETVDLLLDVTNAGRWMAHCHIAEHHQDGMMFHFTVDAG